MSPTVDMPAHEALSPTAKRDWVDVTVRLAMSWVGLFTAYVAALILGLTKYREFTAGLQYAGLPRWSALLLIAVFPICALVFSTIPSAIEQARTKRSAEIKLDLQPRIYFTFRPRDVEEGFERSDGAHEAVLRWIQASKESVLYLTGASGTGKTSVLSAWVVPNLRREGHLVIQLRGYDQILEGIKEGILSLGLWARPPADEIDLSSLFKRVTGRLNGRRLIVVIDQFEEFLILKDAQQQSDLRELLALPLAPGIAFLLVYRSEYEPLIHDQAWPKMQIGSNRRMIAAFTENAALDFLQKSGLILNQDIVRKVLQEACEIDQGTIGLIRPVTINLCGLVLSRFAGSLPNKFRRGIVRGFLEESLKLPEIRDVAGQIVHELITNNLTKRPQTIADLVRATSLEPFVVRACMQRLGDNDRAIVRPLDTEQEIWEISHDFLVPLLDAIVVRGTSSFWRRVRPWLPWAAAAALGIAAIVAPLVSADPRATLAKQGWTVSENQGVLHLSRDDDFPPESASVLRAMQAPYVLELGDRQLTSASVAKELEYLKGLHYLGLSLTLNEVPNLTLLRGFKGIKTISLSGSAAEDLPTLEWLKSVKTLENLNVAFTDATDISSLADLKHLKYFNLQNTDVADVSPLKGMSGLETLHLENSKIEDVSALKDLTRLKVLVVADNPVADISPLKGLRNLWGLNLSGTRVVDVSVLGRLSGLIALVLSNTQVQDISALKDLKKLEHLNLNDTQVRGVSALRDLKELNYVDLGGTQVQDVSALKDLNELTHLDLSGTRVRDVSVLKGLNKLSYLDLSNSQVQDVSALKDLNELAYLDLSGTRVRDVSVLKGLKKLSYLDLSNSQVQDVSALKGTQNLEIIRRR